MCTWQFTVKWNLLLVTNHFVKHSMWLPIRGCCSGLFDCIWMTTMTEWFNQLNFENLAKCHQKCRYLYDNSYSFRRKYEKKWPHSRKMMWKYNQTSSLLDPTRESKREISPTDRSWWSNMECQAQDNLWQLEEDCRQPVLCGGAKGRMKNMESRTGTRTRSGTGSGFRIPCFPYARSKGYSTLI